MDSFLIRPAAADSGTHDDSEYEASSQRPNLDADLSLKLKMLRSLALKPLKLAIESELKANRPQPILSLQAESHSTRSECWKYFSHVLEKENGVPFTSMGKQFVACRACLHTYAFTSDKGTTTLNNHTRTCNIKAANAEAGSIDGFTNSRTFSAREKRRVCRAAAIMCCKDLRPFSFCEGAGFKHFAAVLFDVGARSKSDVNIDDLLPVGNPVKNHVVNAASDARARVIKMLASHFNDGFSAGFTADLWTDTARKLSFMSTTVHFIDEYFKMHSRTLQVKHFEPNSHTAAAVLDFFNDCLRNYRIYGYSPCTIVSDSSANMVDRELFSVVTDSGSNMSSESGFRSQYDWIACADHKVATILTTVLCKTTEMVGKTRSQPFYQFRENAPAVVDVIDGCKALVRYIKQANLQPELSKTLKQENVTRWGSHYSMLTSIVEMYDELAALLTARQKFSYLEKIDRPLLKELVQFLSMLQETTLKLESWTKPTLHLVVLERHRLTELLQPRTEPDVIENDDSSDEVLPADSVSLLAIKQLIRTLSLPKWQLKEKHYIAAMLDPRQKHRHQKFGVDDLIVANTKNLLISLMREYTTAITRHDAQQPPVPPKKKRKRNQRFTSLYSSDESSDEDTALCIPDESPELKELARYFAMRLSATEKIDFDLLIWWKKVASPGENGEPPCFPALGFVARSVLAIPASSAMSESNFSDAGNAFGTKRTVLSPSMLDDILVARSNSDLL